MMSQQNMLWIAALLLMGSITFLLRAAPSILPKVWLKSLPLRALNFALPLCVMLLLILASIHLDTLMHQPSILLAELLSLLMVLLSYHFWRNVLVSMTLGVGAMNFWLWLFAL